MMVLPVVNRIEEGWQSGRVLRLNIAYPFVQEYSEKVAVERTPTFILFDAEGEEIGRWVGVAPDWEELPSDW